VRGGGGGEGRGGQERRAALSCSSPLLSFHLSTVEALRQLIGRLEITSPVQLSTDSRAGEGVPTNLPACLIATVQRVVPSNTKRVSNEKGN